MYLSSLLIDVGNNPDRPRPGRLWLRNLYHVHQRLCMAFPSASRKAADAHFLQPFHPKDFCDNQVHVTRQADCGFLFRIDPLPGGRAMILVQSAAWPDWDYAFHNAGYLLAAPPQVKSFDLNLTRGQNLRFRLVANPTRRIAERSLTNEQATSLTQDGVKQFFEEAQRRAQERGLPRLTERGDIVIILQYSCGHEKRYDFSASRNRKRLFFTAQRACPDCRNQTEKQQDPVKEEWIGSRVPVLTDYLEWLALWVENNGAGFFVDKECTQVQPGYIYVNKNKKQDDKGTRLRSVRYDGILKIIDPARIREAIIRGIGPGKAFGFGLLSVAPYQNPHPGEAP